MHVQLTSKPKSALWNALIFSTGFCSLIYELVFAQLLAGLLGGAFFRFATSLGVYVVGLGLGSVVFRARGFEADQRTFFHAELLLACLGLASVFLFVGFTEIFANDPSSLGLLISTHLVIFAVGLLSGFELPALNSILSSGREEHESETLAYDYYGMFLGSIAFPLLLVPTVGILATLWTVTLLNLLATLATLVSMQDRRFMDWLALSTAAVVNLALLANVDRIESWMSLVYASTI